jgi:uroporphyrinogen III methyltransferase/synthase
MTCVLVTRPAPQAGELVDLLAGCGIHSIAVPTVQTVPARDNRPLDAALRSLGDASWLVITSVNGARALLARLTATGTWPASGTRLAAVGPATARALQVGGLRVDHVPTRYRTVEIADGLGDVRGQRIVLARADAATSGLRDALRHRGALVDEIIAYRTVEGPASSRDELRAALRRPLDGVTFTSGSTVRGLRALLSPLDERRATALPAFCIGPVTAEVARRAGFDVAVVSSEYTVAALAKAIHRYFTKGNA